MLGRRAVATAAAVAVLSAAGVSAAVAAPAPAVAPSVSPYASQKGGPAVVKALGQEKRIALSWQPPKFVASMDKIPKVTYDVVQKGAGLVQSRTTNLNTLVLNLDPNTKYTFTVTSYIKGKKTGSKSVTGLTLPGEVIAPIATGNVLTWQPPEFSTNPITYRVYQGTNLFAINVTEPTFTVPMPEKGRLVTYSISSQNASGESRRSSVTVTGS